MDDKNRLTGAGLLYREVILKSLKRFKKVYIEITNVCNLRCSFCAETKRAPEFMTFNTFRKILEQIQPYTDYVYFHVKGEPLLHPEIACFLDLCYEKGIMVNITTNGTLIQEAADKLLMKPALRQINFSLHSDNGNSSKDNKDEYLRKIFSFIARSVIQSDTIVSLRLWNLKHRGAANGDARKNSDVLGKIESAFHLPFKIDEEAISARGLKLAEKVYLSQDAEFEWPSCDKEEDFSPGFCYGLKSHAAILVDGTVVPCCLDGEGLINLGNIHTTPFSEIIDGEKATRIQRGFSSKEVVEELCRKCTYRKRFNKTPKIPTSI